MKKLNIAQAEAIVGGKCKTCTDAFEWVSNGGVEACNAVQTCTDKHGVVTKTYKVAPSSSCKQPG